MRMNKVIGKAARFAVIGVALLCIAGCEKEETPAERNRRLWGDIKTKADLEKMRTEAEAQRRADQEKFSKTIGGAMVKRTLETADGTAKKDKEADDRVKRALDRDFGVAPKKQTPVKEAETSPKSGK